MDWESPGFKKPGLRSHLFQQIKVRILMPQPATLLTCNYSISKNIQRWLIHQHEIIWLSFKLDKKCVAITITLCSSRNKMLLWKPGTAPAQRSYLIMFTPFTGTTVALVSTMVFHPIEDHQTGSQVMAKSKGQESVNNEYHISHPIVSL